LEQLDEVFYVALGLTVLSGLASGWLAHRRLRERQADA
jgi:hypothetical protein